MEMRSLAGREGEGEKREGEGGGEKEGEKKKGERGEEGGKGRREEEGAFCFGVSPLPILSYSYQFSVSKRLASCAADAASRV